MPVDTSIYSNIQPFQSPNQLNQLAAIGQIQASQNQNRLADLQFQQAQRAQAQQEGLSNAYRDATDAATGKVDYGRVQANLATGGFGAAIPGVAKSAADAQKAQAEAQKATLEGHSQQLGLIGQVMGAVKDQSSYDAAVNYLRSHIPDGGKDLPAQYDPNIVQQTVTRALTTKEQVDKLQKDLDYQLKVRQQTETERNNKAQNAVAQGNLSVAQGQLGVAQAGLGLRRQELEAGKVPAGYRRTADGNLEAIPGGPADFKNNKENNQRIQDAKDVLAIADQAEQLLGKASNGYLSSGYNQALGALGSSTAAAQADAQLKVLQGAMVSKMPKMSGPQSDKDVLLYREMAGQIGDPTVPVAQRRAALQTVRDLQRKYLGQDTAAPAKSATSSDGWSVTEVK